MIELLEKDIVATNNKSSKGNQLKWNIDNYWYKADFAGYEGLSEVLVSKMLKYSTLSDEEYVSYEPEQVKYKTTIFNGCKSKNFLKNNGQQLITLERLYSNFCGESLYKSLFRIHDEKERFSFLVNQIERITGIKQFALYLNKIVTIDALTLNEDRHMHNIAVIMNMDGTYDLCPIFDQGAGLLSDTTLDYPIDEDVYKLIDSVKAKTFSSSFDEQLEISEAFAGNSIKFTFTKSDVRLWLEDEQLKKMYSKKILERVGTVAVDRMRKYQYLFL